MARRKSFVNPDDDLGSDDQLNEYEPSDSDDDYDDNEKLLLEKARKGKALDDEDDDDDEEDSDEEEVLKIYSSEEEGKDEGMKNMDSDIEGMEDDDKLPDSKAWGKRKKDYYYTDYVDKDHGGFERYEEEEIALMEEKEARTLQSRLAAQLDDVDLSLGLTLKDSKSKDIVKDDEGDDDEEDVIKTDLSKLTKREKLALFQKESPEFFGLVNDYKERLSFAKDKLFPLLRLIRSDHIPSYLPCSKFVELKTLLTLNYCTNLAFYLMLKKKRVPVKNHPVIGRLLKYRSLLQKLDELETPKYIEQLNDIIETYNNDNIDSINVSSSSDSKQKRSKTKKKLKILSDAGIDKSSDLPKKKSKKVKFEDQNEHISVDDNKYDDLMMKDSDNDDDDDDEEEEEQEVVDDKSNEPLNKKSKLEVNADGKRPITYEIAKNKGLTPYRKKEQRNPRVKHRNKYRKAIIRRKGQVRLPDSEIRKYGGEVFGIKASVIKSRSFK